MEEKKTVIISRHGSKALKLTSEGFDKKAAPPGSGFFKLSYTNENFLILFHFYHYPFNQLYHRYIEEGQAVYRKKLRNSQSLYLEHVIQERKAYGAGYKYHTQEKGSYNVFISPELFRK